MRPHKVTNCDPPDASASTWCRAPESPVGRDRLWAGPDPGRKQQDTPTSARLKTQGRGCSALGPVESPLLPMAQEQRAVTSRSPGRPRSRLGVLPVSLERAWPPPEPSSEGHALESPIIFSHWPQWDKNQLTRSQGRQLRQRGTGPRASRPDPDALRVPFMVLNPGHIPKSPRNPGSVSKLL